MIFVKNAIGSLIAGLKSIRKVINMIYKEYEEYRTKYYEAQKIYDSILNVKEELFIRTQPSSIKFDKEIVSGGTPSNAFDSYLIVKEKKQIDERLIEAKSILDDRGKLFRLKEEELYHSKDWNDIIYKYYFIEKLSIRKIAMRIPFSSTEVFRKIQIIRKNINLEQKGTKAILK